MDKRTILAIVLSLAVLLVYQIFFVKPPVPSKGTVPQASTGQVRQDADAPSTPAPAATTASARPALKSAVGPQAPPRDITVETAHYTAVFSTRGAALKSLKLKDYYRDCHECTDDIWPKIKGLVTGTKAPLKPKTPEFVELVDVREGMPYPLAVTFPESGADIAPDEVFEAAQSKLDLTGSREKQQLVFSKSFHNVKIEKIFSFDPSGYTIGMDVKVYNLTGTPITQIPQLNWYQYVDPQKIDDSYGHEGPIVSVGGSVGLYAARQPGATRWMLPVGFVLAMLAGAGLGALNVALPAVEGLQTSALDSDARLLFPINDALSALQQLGGKSVKRLHLLVRYELRLD